MQDAESNNDVAPPAPHHDPVLTLTPAQVERFSDDTAAKTRHAVHISSFKSRSQGFVAGLGLGAFFGAAIGTLAVLSTAIISVHLAAMAAMFLPVVAVFAATGAAMGAAILTEVDMTTGVVVGNAKAQLRKKLIENPKEGIKEVIASEKHANAPEAEPGFLNRIIPFTKGSNGIINWRNALVFGALGLAAGALVLSAAGGASVLAGIGAIGIAAAKASVPLAAVTKCMTFATCGLFGASFGLDIPVISANAVEYVAGMFSGKFFPGESKEPDIAKSIAAAIPRSAQVQGPVVFNGNTVSTLSTPIGGYAGNEAGLHLRKIAEQQLKTMDTSQVPMH